MIRASGSTRFQIKGSSDVRGPGFNSRLGPFLVHPFLLALDLASSSNFLNICGQVGSWSSSVHCIACVLLCKYNVFLGRQTTILVALEFAIE